MTYAEPRLEIEALKLLFTLPTNGGNHERLPSQKNTYRLFVPSFYSHFCLIQPDGMDLTENRVQLPSLAIHLPLVPL